MDVSTKVKDFGHGYRVMLHTIEHDLGEVEYVVEVEEDYNTVSESEYDEDYLAAKEDFYYEVKNMKERLQK